MTPFDRQHWTAGERRLCWQGRLTEQPRKEVAGELENGPQNGIDDAPDEAAKIAWRRVGVEDDAAQDPRHDDGPVFIHDRYRVGKSVKVRSRKLASVSDYIP